MLKVPDILLAERFKKAKKQSNKNLSQKSKHQSQPQNLLLFTLQLNDHNHHPTSTLIIQHVIKSPTITRIKHTHPRLVQLLKRMTPMTTLWIHKM